MKVLVTGIAGFIGFHVAQRLITEGFAVVGIDNLNNYYDVQLKKDRLKELGIIEFENTWTSSSDQLCFIKMDLQEKESLLNLFSENRFDYVIHLAAQAGVRYSLTEPQKYVDSNITGFLNILEACRKFPIKHLLFASSSSVYGLNEKIPFIESDQTDSPISMYAATKKANELMAHTYSHLFNIPTTGLRFFTVYGPWGRPDMAISIFTNSILLNKKIELFNLGHMRRDFTYIDDVIESIYRLIDKPIVGNSSKFSIFNVGKSEPIELFSFIKSIEDHANQLANVEFFPIQPGDVEATYADASKLFEYINFQPNIGINEGVMKFVNWYKKYYEIND
jgi:UDP-glucuronate 4-epimerase